MASPKEGGNEKGQSRKQSLRTLYDRPLPISLAKYKEFQYLKKFLLKPETKLSYDHLMSSDVDEKEKNISVDEVGRARGLS
ncbi:hypothetical protein AVEN_229637-1 [Araneus ventricosus]|uniref:Uncharacterized protein n=1 Tax=Araneus ventricosus TaxID=182803 RepID=A0A4Y2HUK6_ARAVE|nr:hypothetical protein AVEN_229637-1 [Araneus ventricosus]